MQRRRFVDERAVPQLEHEERPDALSMVRRGAIVLVEHPPDDAVVEVVATSRLPVEEHVVRDLAKVAAEPVGKWRLEAALGGVQDLVWYPAPKCDSQSDLLLRAPDLETCRQRRGELHELVVEEWRAALERARHRGDIDLGEEVIRQIGRGVRIEQTVQERVPRRLTPRSPDDVLDDRGADETTKLRRVQLVAAQTLQGAHVGDVTPGEVERQGLPDPAQSIGRAV